MNANLAQVRRAKPSARKLAAPIDWRKLLYLPPGHSPGGADREIFPGHFASGLTSCVGHRQDRQATHGAPALRSPIRGFPALDEKAQRELHAFLLAGEKVVFAQVIAPNREAWLCALADAAWDEATNYAKPADQIHIEIEHRHLARGLGLRLDHYQAVFRRVRSKVTRYLKDGGLPHCPHEARLRRLELLFGLPVLPANVPFQTVRRVLIHAARERPTKLTPEAARLLHEIGVNPQQIAMSSTLTQRSRR